MAVPTGSAGAEPKPTLAQAKKKLDKLNEQADQVVEKYNQASEKWKRARKKYQTLNADLTRQSERVAGLRKELVTMAVSSYQFGAVGGLENLVSQADPGALLSGLATADQMSATRAQSLNAFDEATKELRDSRDKAKQALDEADQTRDELAGEKAKAEKMIKAQKKLLRELGAYNPGDPNSAGIQYNGPASGNARAALEFAFAQIGKPYQYGGTGPGGWDCSGLVQAAWRSGGVSLPRTTWEQWSWGAARKVSLNELQAGDLIFSEGLGHVGMYTGDGRVVHAPQTGDVVKVVPLSGYGRRLVGAVRP
ncbi:cell wall-associated NlpC family hydrolase [Streptosporangium becharense]|uniref:Cell wall-associated NlpC family hydrolase n=1 Tax=Streptosporangium becharense TaxID=1816182 RepID=A0A7W9ID00_9ACTN|nr:C40 family peptidase [Streptosporangium becharense]MBB2911883.1 cell wall-associated NlpC family hydrolase [Streptosporangium becharense]MBB5818430.1 cell wall-associated NlpC family hydrolase [Streptosporangium becharense]